METGIDPPNKAVFAGRVRFESIIWRKSPTVAPVRVAVLGHAI
jgi:hypothetical protein